MSREIKFRGLRVANNEMIYGYFVVTPNGEHRIYLQPFEEATSNTFFSIEPDTLGQYTGLKDKNGVEIYEGDIVSNTAAKWIIVDDRGCFSCKIIDTRYNNDKHIALRAIIGAEVIGNIHQNTELLNK